MQRRGVFQADEDGEVHAAYLFYFAHEGSRSWGGGGIIWINSPMSFGLLKEGKNERCSGLEDWKLPRCRQNGFGVGYVQAPTGWFSLLCLGSPHPQSLKLEFSKQPKCGVEAGNIAP